MEEIIKQIEEEYATQMQEAQDALSVAQMNFDNLVGSKEEKIRAVRVYYEAIAQRDQAQSVIDSTNDDIKAQVISAEAVKI